MASTITFTYGQIENHVGMQQVGNIENHGFSEETLLRIQKQFEDKSEMVYLGNVGNVNDKKENACVLVIRNYLQSIEYCDEFIKEHKKVLKKCDTKALMRGRVVNKQARYNLCYADIGQEAEIEKGKGTIVSFSDLPFTNRIRKDIHSIIEKTETFETNGMPLAELNYYYSLKKCGIGYHGDTERRTVIGLRIHDIETLNEKMPIHFQWYYRHKPIDKEHYSIDLGHGDMYIMSNKAVGFDWKRSSIPTLRHATGVKKYTTV